MVKNHNPLDPQYVMRSESGHRQMMYGQIEGNKPVNLIKAKLNKDTKRYMTVTDINGP